MNLTIEQLSKITKLSVPTLYTYASRQKLGKKVGNKRVFSQADVQKLLKRSKKPPQEKKAKPPAKKRGKRAIKTTVATPKAASSNASSIAVRSTNPSFWTRLFGGRKEMEKVTLRIDRANM
jgi:hypothetical protein